VKKAGTARQPTIADVTGPERRFDQLGVHVYGSTAGMAVAAAADIAMVLSSAVESRGTANAMFATGNSQLAMLQALVAEHHIEWNRIRVLHMDEYVGLGDDHPASFARYIRERIVSQVHPLAAFYVGNTLEAAAEYAEVLHQYPLDLCVLGIGENGHLAFNDPAVADFSDPLDVKVVELDEACRRQQVGEGHFSKLEDVPARAVTVTIPALLRGRDVVVVCPEERKAQAVHDALTGPVSTTCPASVLRSVPHARLYLDAGSASLL
jgi:glucosamine-6-phosphate deaminase